MKTSHLLSVITIILLISLVQPVSAWYSYSNPYISSENAHSSYTSDTIRSTTYFPGGKETSSTTIRKRTTTEYFLPYYYPQAQVAQSFCQPSSFRYREPYNSYNYRPSYYGNTYTTPYYYQPSYDPCLGHYNWRY